MKKNNLNKLAPSFYNRATVYGLLFAYLSIVLLSSFSRFNVAQSYIILRDLIPVQAWGILFGIAGFGTLIAVNFLRDIWIRLYIAIGVGLATMWSIGLLIVYLSGLDVGPVGFAIFAFIALIGYNLVLDPHTGNKKNGIT